MHQYRRRSSLSEILESLSETRTPLCREGSLRQHPALQDVKNNKTLRRCKSNPEKKKYQKSPQEWQRILDKERGYITDLIADNEPAPIRAQPQLSYFAYLGSSDPRKEGYQSVTFSDATETIINLGNAIYFQNQTKRPSSTANQVPMVNEHPWYTIREPPVKADNTRLVECCSCMCCVKALFYHCTKDHELEGNWAAQPCACAKPGVECVARWGILGVLSLIMPCLLCYPFLNGCC